MRYKFQALCLVKWVTLAVDELPIDGLIMEHQAQGHPMRSTDALEIGG